MRMTKVRHQPVNRDQNNRPRITSQVVTKAAMACGTYFPAHVLLVEEETISNE